MTGRLPVKKTADTKKRPSAEGLFCDCCSTGLDDSNFGAGHGAAAEGLNAAGLELYNAVVFSVDGKVAADKRAFAGALGHADLAYDNLASLYFLAAKKLNAKALAGGVVDVFAGTASFDV